MDLSAVPIGDPVTLPPVSIPVLVWAVVSAVAALVAALVPQDKLPPALRRLLDVLGSNWGAAANAPTKPPEPPHASNLAPPRLPRQS